MAKRVVCFFSKVLFDLKLLVSSSAINPQQNKFFSVIESIASDLFLATKNVGQL